MQRMNLQQGRPFANGYSSRRVDTVMGTRMESKTQVRKSASPNFGNANYIFVLLNANYNAMPS